MAVLHVNSFTRLLNNKIELPYNIIMNTIVKVNLKDIVWDVEDFEDDDIENVELPDLPTELTEYEVYKTSDYDHYEKWNEEDNGYGFDLFMEDLVEQLSDEYGWCINYIGEVEIINED